MNLTDFHFSFGYPSANTATSTAATSTHLQNQNYQACVGSRGEIFERGEKYLRSDKKTSRNAEG